MNSWDRAKHWDAHAEPETEKEYLDRKALAMHIWTWQHSGTNFSSMLVALIHKADPGNQFRIEKGFPGLISVYREWEHSPSQEAFFNRYGV